MNPLQMQLRLSGTNWDHSYRHTVFFSLDFVSQLKSVANCIRRLHISWYSEISASSRAHRMSWRDIFFGEILSQFTSDMSFILNSIFKYSRDRNTSTYTLNNLGDSLCWTKRLLLDFQFSLLEVLINVLYSSYRNQASTQSFLPEKSDFQKRRSR